MPYNRQSLEAHLEEINLFLKWCNEHLVTLHLSTPTQELKDDQMLPISSFHLPVSGRPLPPAPPRKGPASGVVVAQLLHCFHFFSRLHC